MIYLRSFIEIISDELQSLEGHDGKDQSCEHQDESLQYRSEEPHHHQDSDENVSDDQELRENLCCENVDVQHHQKVVGKLSHHFGQEFLDDGDREDAVLIAGENAKVEEGDEHEQIALKSQSEHL